MFHSQLFNVLTVNYKLFIQDYDDKRLFWLSTFPESIFSSAYDGANIRQISLKDGQLGFLLFTLVFQVSIALNANEMYAINRPKKSQSSTQRVRSLRVGWLLVLDLYNEDYLQIFKCVYFWLYSFCG